MNRRETSQVTRGCQGGGGIDPDGKLAGLTLEQLRDQYRKDLFDDFLPFMDKYIIDHELGGFMCHTDRDGSHLSTKKNSWDIWDYYYEVIDASTAIFLHNSYRYSELKNIFGNGKFQYDYPSALGYLLYLSDSLCEWLRDRKNDYKLYGVNVDNNRIVFRVPKKTKSKIGSAAKLFDDRIPIDITDKWSFEI